MDPLSQAEADALLFSLDVTRGRIAMTKVSDFGNVTVRPIIERDLFT